MTPEEQKLFRLYGKMPNKKDLLQNKLKVSWNSPVPSSPTPLRKPHANHLSPHFQERKYFDSGDYALSKAGKASDVGVTSIGSRHPVPENIPHLTATSPGANNPGAASNGGGVNTQGQHIPGSISGHPGSIGFQSRSPVKEGSFLHRGSSLSEGSAGPDEDKETKEAKEAKEPSVSPPPAREGVPIRR
jgi:hypothetical protein